MNTDDAYNPIEINGVTLKADNEKNLPKKIFSICINILKSNEYGETCPESQTGEHIYINNICMCGKVCEVIEEDEEEYDDEGNCCPKSKSGNHHFRAGAKSCFYCSVVKTERMTIRKTMKKAQVEDLSILNNNPFILEEGLISRKASKSQFGRISADNRPILETKSPFQISAEAKKCKTEIFENLENDNKTMGEIKEQEKEQEKEQIQLQLKVN
jgi:hypothetical protein